MATKTLLAEFLREIRDVSNVQRKPTDSIHQYKHENDKANSLRYSERGEKILDLSMEDAERAAFIIDREERSSYDVDSTLKDDHASEFDYRDTGGLFANILLWLQLRYH